MKILEPGVQKQFRTAFLALFFGAPAVAQADFVEIGHSVGYLQTAAQGRFAKADIDGDGRLDMIFIGTAPTPILMAVGRKADNAFGVKLAKVVADDGHMARVLVRNVQGADHILTISVSGVVREYSGWPLVEQRSFNVVPDVTAAEIGDINLDGTDDLVLATSGKLNVYSLADGQMQWDYPIVGTSDLALAQLDADPAMEIILAGPVPGVILDGATQATDWQYIDGFGQLLATGPLAAGGGTQWIGAQAWYQFSVFRASPWSPLWSGWAAGDIDAIATANLDSNGQNDILLGDGQWGAVHVINPQTQQERFQIPNQAHGMNAITGIDFDADGKDEIAFAGFSAYNQAALLSIANGQNGLVEWEFVPSSGPFVATALGDVDGDGRIELVAAARGGNLPGTIAIFDAATGLEEWRSPAFIGNANDPFYIEVASIALAPRTGAPGMDIVLAGTSIYDGRIVVMDGTTNTVRLQIGTYAAGPMRSRYLEDMKLVDFDSDGALDYVAATNASTTGASGALLQVFSGVNGDPLWTSVAMGTGFAPINGVLVADGAGGPASKQLIAVLPDSLRSFDSATGLLSWTLAATNDGAFLVPNGENGAEIGVFLDDGTVTFYAASNQTHIRSYSLPAPLRAITPLGGDLGTLLAASANALTLVNGESGTIVSTTDYLGPFPEQGSRLAGVEVLPSSWMISTGTESALYRFRLETGDSIFANSFENP